MVQDLEERERVRNVLRDNPYAFKGFSPCICFSWNVQPISSFSIGLITILCLQSLFLEFSTFFFFFRLSSGRFSWVHLNTEIGFSLTWHSLTFFRALCFSCYETPDWSPCQVWEVCLRPSFPGHKWSRRGTLSISSYFPSTFYVPGTGTGIGKRIVKKQNPRPHGS